MRIVDVVILSYCSTPEQFRMNMKCIGSLTASEPGLSFNIVVVESNREWFASGFNYDSPAITVLVPQEPFNFNRFLNFGIRQTKNEIIVLANNDLIFHARWLSEMLKVNERHPDILSFCPFDRTSRFLRWEDFRSQEFVRGYRVPIEYVGWCVVVFRSVLERTGLFDETFDLYFQDNDFANTLKKSGIAHALVPTSFVEHIGGATTKIPDPSKTKQYAKDRAKFVAKWKQSTAQRIKSHIMRLIYMLFQK